MKTYLYTGTVTETGSLVLTGQQLPPGSYKGQLTAKLELEASGAVEEVSAWISGGVGVASGVKYAPGAWTNWSVSFGVESLQPISFSVNLDCVGGSASASATIWFTFEEA